MWPLTPLAIAMLLLGGSAPQRTATAADARTTETPHVKVTTSAGAAVDHKLPLFLDVAPKPRMYVYAPGQAGYIAVTLTVTSQPGLTPAAPRFPQPEKVFFERLDETQLIYSRPFRIVQEVTLTGDPAEARTIKGSLRYQACDHQVCYLPRTIAVEWRIAPKKV